MKNLWMAAALFCGAVAFASCNSNTQETDTTSNVDTERNAQAVADSSLTDEKREFMGYAYNISTQQVELGRLAAEKGQTDQVRQYGQQMVDIYSKKLKELQEMAGQYSVTLPQNMTDDQADKVEDLRDEKAGEFDRKYWDTVVEAHKDALSEFEDNVKDIEETDNTTFNLWARNTAKEVRAQMEQAMRFRTDSQNR
jgi:putative membrane protein